MITYDAILDLKTALTCDWGCCVGATPTTDLVWDKKVVGFDGDVSERIILTPLGEPVIPFALHGDAYWHDVVIKVDIRTYQSGGITRQNVVVKEVDRIIKNMIRRNTGDLLQIVILKGETRNQDYRNMFRHIIELRYQGVKDHTFV